MDLTGCHKQQINGHILRYLKVIATQAQELLSETSGAKALFEAKLVVGESLEGKTVVAKSLRYYN